MPSALSSASRIRTYASHTTSRGGRHRPGRPGRRGRRRARPPRPRPAGRRGPANARGRRIAHVHLRSGRPGGRTALPDRGCLGAPGHPGRAGRRYGSHNLGRRPPTPVPASARCSGSHHQAAGDHGHFVQVAVVRLTGAGPARAESPPADSAGHPTADPGHPMSTAAVTIPTHLTPDHVASDAFPATTPRHGVSLPGHMGTTPPGHSAAAATHFSGLVGMPAAHAPTAGPMETPGMAGPMPTNASGGRHGEEGTDWFDAGLAELWEVPLQRPHDLSVPGSSSSRPDSRG